LTLRVLTCRCHGKLRADAAVSPLGHITVFSNYPQVHFSPGGAINNGNASSGFDNKIVLTA